MEDLNMSTVDGYSQFIHPDDLDRVKAAYRHSDDTGEVTEVEYRFQSPSGKIGHVIERLVPSLWRDGKVVEQIGTVQDVTESMHKQEELENAQRLGEFGSFRWDLNRHKLISCSPEFMRIFGYSEDEIFDLPGDFWIQAHHQDDHERIIDYLNNLDPSDNPYEIEYRIQTTDGDVRYLVEHGETVWHSGEVIELRGSVQDVTESRRIEAELDEAQRISNVGSYRTDFVNDRLISFSPQLARI